LQNCETQHAIVDFASKSAVALAAEFAVPAGCWEPDFDLDIGVGGRLGSGGYSAKGWETFVKVGIAGHPRGHTCWGSEGAGGDGLGGGYFCVWEGELGELLAGLR
jgi:hypothetical protein